MGFDLIVRNGTIATSKGTLRADIGVRGGKIAQIGDLSEASAPEEIDAEGLHVLPGVIDTQVHFREPGLEHKEDIESGTRAAIMAGVTTIFEMPNTNPPTTTREALEDKLRRADGRAWCDYSFFVGAALDNLDALGELERLPGTPGIKIFVGSSTGSLLVEADPEVRRAFQSGKRPMPIHSEDEPRNRRRKEEFGSNVSGDQHADIRDAESARLCTERVINLCRETGRPIHILHISTADELPLLRAAKDEGLPVTCEATPQHLFFYAPEAYARLGTLVQQNPPIRTREHRDAIREALRDGLFDVFGSDHAPHTLEEKAKPYPASPSGMPGVQTMLPMLLRYVQEGLITLSTMVRMTSERPAELYGVRGKGKIEEGYDADLVILDPDKPFVFNREMVQSKCGWSPFEGETLYGKPVHVLLRGKVAVQNGSLQNGPQGRPAEFDWK